MSDILDVTLAGIESQPLRAFLATKLEMMSLPLAVALIEENEGEEYFVDAGEDGFNDDYHTLLVSQEDAMGFYADNKAELLQFLEGYAVAKAYKSGVDALAHLGEVKDFFDVFEIEDALANSHSDCHAFIVAQLIYLASLTLLNQYIDYRA